MTIKEVSEKFNISQDTLRYYEKIGLIKDVKRKNGIRQYEEKELARIEFIVCMRSAGLSIDSLIKYMNLLDRGDGTELERKQLLINERDRLMKRMEEINGAIDKLNYKIDFYEKILLKEPNKNSDMR